MNSIFQMFNDDYIREQARQAQKAQQERQEQAENIMKSAHKLKEFLNSLDEIKPEYREDAARLLGTMVYEYFYMNKRI